MRYKNSDDNRYRVQFMRSTEELMDQLTVKEFISYLEENAEFEDYTVEYIDKKCVKCRAYDLTEENSKLHKEFLVTEDGRVFYWRSLISKIELVDAEEEKQEVSKMVIKRLKGAKFGTDRIARVVTGYALYEEGKGYIAFSSDRDEFGILAPYIPCGGKRALQSILDMYRSWEPKGSDRREICLQFILRVLEAQRNTLQSLKQRRRLRAFVESMAGSG